MTKTCLREKRGDFKNIIACGGLSYLKDVLGFLEPMSAQGVTVDQKTSNVSLSGLPLARTLFCGGSTNGFSSLFKVEHLKLRCIYFNSSSVIFEFFYMHKMLLKVYAAVSFACADDGIGKCDRSTLSQQDLMELFIFGLAEPENCTTEGVLFCFCFYSAICKLHVPFDTYAHALCFSRYSCGLISSRGLKTTED